MRRAPPGQAGGRGAPGKVRGAAAGRGSQPKSSAVPVDFSGGYASLRSCTEPESPRLSSSKCDGIRRGAPLVPPMPELPEERFCTGETRVEFPAPKQKGPEGDAVESIADIVTQLEIAMNQATLLLSQRLLSLQERQKVVVLAEAQVQELCRIADMILAASYHVGKWAAALAKDPADRPVRPIPCSDSEEAFSSMRIAMPRLAVNAAGARAGLDAALRERGEGAEAWLRQKGVPSEDLRALGPHLQGALQRLNVLLNGLKRRSRPAREGEGEGEPTPPPPGADEYVAPLVSHA